MKEQQYRTTISASELDQRDAKNRKAGRAEAALGALLAAVLIKKRKRVAAILKNGSK